jgi:hypothetical protein
VTNPTDDGPAGYATTTGWSERSITWSNMPAVSGAAADDEGEIGARAWVDYDVTTLVRADGPVAFGLVSTSSDGLQLSSREASRKPQLVVTFVGGTAACGDGVCTSDETCSACAADCGSCSATGYGPKADYAPSYDVAVPVGQLTQALLDGKPEGTRFGIAAGRHRLATSLRPRARQQFLGLPGAIVDGSKVLSSWTHEATAGRWYVGGQTQRLPIHGECRADAPACKYAEDVFYDGRWLWQVLSLAELAPGRFFFDYASSRIYLADDPTGHLVETTVAPGFLSGASGRDDVVVQNLVVEKFGNRAQVGAIGANGATGWKAIDDEVRLNHGVGTMLDGGSTARGNYVHHNGQLGMGGDGPDMLVERNQIAYNQDAMGYETGWEAGGSKWAVSDRLVLRGNWSHHNAAAGLWVDIDNVDALIEENLCEDNDDAGIFYEISYRAVIRNNVIRRNGHRDPAWGYGAGIQISASRDVEVYGNTVEDNARGIVGIMQERGSGPLGLHEVTGLSVHDNTVRHGGPMAAAIVQDVGDLSYFTTKNNRFTRNSYHLAATVARPFEWKDVEVSAATWRASGNDVDGTFSTY